MLEERNEVVCQTRNGQPRQVPDGMRLAVAAEIQRQQPDSGRGPVHRTGLARVAAEPMLEHEGKALPFLTVVEIQSIALEYRHARSSKEPSPPRGSGSASRR